MSNVVNLAAFRDIKEREFSNPFYQARIAKMDRLELVNEVIKFNEERYEHGGLNKELIVRGLILFKNMADNAETPNFKEFARTYCKHLELELQVIKGQYF